MGSRRPFYRRGTPRGYRGQNSGTGDFLRYGQIPPPQVRTIYDYTLDRSNLAGCKNTTDAVFEKEIINRAANLTPTAEIKKRFSDYAKKVIVALEKEKAEKTLTDIGITNIVHVGSFVTDTATHSSDKSDIVVQLNTLPSCETILELGEKVCANMRAVDPKETGMSIQKEYGCIISSHYCSARILITINPDDSPKLEPGLHLDEKHLMINYFAVRHTNWFLDLKKNMPAEFIQEYQALVRVLKDARSRFSDFQPLSVWALQYLAFYCLTNGPSRQKLCLGTAFRRFFEFIAAGIFLPKAPCFIDPTFPSLRIGFDLDLQKMDKLCIGAQTLVRIFATGNDGYRTILGTEGTAADLTKSASTWNGLEIFPSIDAYKDGCMENKLSSEGAPNISTAMPVA